MVQEISSTHQLFGHELAVLVIVTEALPGIELVFSDKIPPSAAYVRGRDIMADRNFNARPTIRAGLPLAQLHCFHYCHKYDERSHGFALFLAERPASAAWMERIGIHVRLQAVVRTPCR